MLLLRLYYGEIVEIDNKNRLIGISVDDSLHEHQISPKKTNLQRTVKARFSTNFFCRDTIIINQSKWLCFVEYNEKK